MSSLPPLLPRRECGACTVCCVELDIDDPELRKPDGVACPHLKEAGGCGIYDHRPATCRHWFCGWRFLHLSDAMRPDRSGVLLSPEFGAVKGAMKGGLRIVLVDDDIAVLDNPELIDFAARCVAGDVPIFLSWGHGGMAKRRLINADVAELVRQGERAGFVAALHAMLDAMRLAYLADMQGVARQ